jgi:ankyrin repeat protein
MYASYRGHTATVQALIGAGADRNLQSKDDNTALMFACKSGYATTVQELIGEGADLNLQNKVSGGLVLI